MKWYKKLQKIVESCYLCSRFVFLYPRNRWDGKHHAYILQNLRSSLYHKAIQEISFTGILEKEVPKDVCHTVLGENFTVNLDKKNNKLVVYNKTDKQEINLDTIIDWKNKFDIIGITSYSNYSFYKNIIVHVSIKDKTDTTNYGFRHYKVELIKSRFYLYLYRIIKWIDKNILDKVFFFPTFTELDTMEPGWRKAFGIQMCKEIKQALKKHNYLYKYRITQIKEKWGFLHWYDAGAPIEVHDIISKYEDISWNTCIICGKPSTKITAGWILPYCDDCFPKEHIIYQEKINGIWQTTKEYEDLEI